MKLVRVFFVLLAGIVMVAITSCQSVSPAPPVFTPKAFTAEEYQDISWNSIMAHFPDAERPSVTVVRVIDNSEFPLLYEACMQEEGFPVKVNADTSFEATVPPGQEEPFALAMYVCEAKYPRPFLLTVPENDVTGRILYAYYRDHLLGCLIQNGYEAEPLPSEAKYLENLYTGEGYYPYAGIIQSAGLDFAEWERLNAACPQRPAELGG